MKNKILVAIQESSTNIDSYLNYFTSLARDFDFDIDLISTHLTLKNTEQPVAILGEGLSLPSKNKKHSLLKTLNEKSNNWVKYTKDFPEHSIHERIEASALDIINKKELQQNILLWTINQISNDSFINTVFGTTETEFLKQTTLPSLTLPEDCKYSKPKTILVVVRDTPDLDLGHLYALTEHMNLRIVFAYHEDEKEDITIKNIMDSMQISFSDFNGSFKSFNADNNDNKIFDTLINQEQPEWIAFANYDRSFFERFYKLNTNHLILSTKLPVLNF